MPEQNGYHYADDILEYIFMQEKLCLARNFTIFFLDIQLIIIQHWVAAWRRNGTKQLRVTNANLNQCI